MAETLPGFRSLAWFGIVAPPKTPAADRGEVLGRRRRRAEGPRRARRLQELSAEPLGLGPAEIAAFMKQETERWGDVIRAAKVKLE